MAFVIWLSQAIFYLMQVVLALDCLVSSHFRLCAIWLRGLCRIGYATWKLPFVFPFKGFDPTCSHLCVERDIKHEFLLIIIFQICYIPRVE